MPNKALIPGECQVRDSGKIDLLFELFASAPTITTPSNMTAKAMVPLEGGTSTAERTWRCRKVEVTQLATRTRIRCHMQPDPAQSLRGDIHDADGDDDGQGGKTIKVSAPVNWAQGGGDSSLAFTNAVIDNNSGVDYLQPTHHWDSKPFQVQAAQFTVDSIVTHQYGVFKVEHRVGRTGGWTQAAVLPKIGADPTKPRVPVWRSTLTPPGTDTLDGTIQVRVTPLRGDAGSIFESGAYDETDEVRENWDAAKFFHPHETDLPTIFNGSGTLNLGQVFAAVKRDAMGTGQAQTTEAAALLTPFRTIELAKLGIRTFRGDNTVNGGVIVCMAGDLGESRVYFFGDEPVNQTSGVNSTEVDNKVPIVIRPASGLSREQITITPAAFAVRIPSSMSPMDGRAEVVVGKFRITPDGITWNEYNFGTGQNQYATVSALVAAIISDEYDAVAINPDLSTLVLDEAFQDELEDNEFRWFAMNHSNKGMWVRRLQLQNITTHTSKIRAIGLLGEIPNQKPASLILEWCKHQGVSRASTANQVQAHFDDFPHGIWAYNCDFDNLFFPTTRWVYARDCYFRTIGKDALFCCMGAVNPKYEACTAFGSIHPDLFQFFFHVLNSEEEVRNILLLNADASDPSNVAQPFFFRCRSSTQSIKRVAIINYRYNIEKAQAFLGQFDGVVFWNNTGLQGIAKEDPLAPQKILFGDRTGEGAGPGQHRNISVRNSVIDRLNISAVAVPSLWAILDEDHITSELKEEGGILVPDITAYPDCTTNVPPQTTADLFTDLANGDLSPNQNRTAQPHLFDRPTSVPMIWPFDALGVERISDGTGAIGAIERLRIATLADLNVEFGTTISGGLSNLVDSDNSYLQVRSVAGFQVQEPFIVQLVVGMTTTVQSRRKLKVRIEARSDNPGGTVRIFLKDWGTGTPFVQVRTFAIGTIEVVDNFEVDVANYVRSSDGRIELRYYHFHTNTFSVLGFDAFVDQIRVVVE